MTIAEQTAGELLQLFGDGPVVAPDLGLRPYQQVARDAVRLALQLHRSTLTVLPTGTGKTRLGAAVIWDFVERGEKVLVLCPTITLVHQMYDDLREVGLDVGIEQATNRVRRPLPQVTVACVATMRGKRLKSFTPTTFGLIVVDEAHRSISSLYAGVLSHFFTAKLLGLTATPDRTDGVSLRNVFVELAYEMTMLAAIEQGWLTPLRFRTVMTDFRASSLRTKGGDVSAASSEAELVRSGVLHQAASTLADLSSDERIVGFTPTVASSKALVAELMGRGVAAAHVDGTTPTPLRKQIFREFVDGKVRAISNVGVLTEGWDCPTASVVALLNPTRSRSRLTQMIGRGTRLAPGKTSCLVLDFCPGRLQKGRLASPADALAGEMLPDGVHSLLPPDGDLAQAITRARKTHEEIEETKRQKEEAAQRKRERLDRLSREARKREFTYEMQDHDAASILSRYAPANDSQLMQRVVEGPSEDERRKRSGLVSVKQAKILAKHGLNPDMNWRVARPILDAYFANNYKFADDILADPKYQIRRQA